MTREPEQDDPEGFPLAHGLESFANRVLAPLVEAYVQELDARMTGNMAQVETARKIRVDQANVMYLGWLLAKLEAEGKGEEVAALWTRINAIETDTAATARLTDELRHVYGGMGH